MSNLITPKDHADWLTLRESGIGSSEVAVLMGVSPYETPLQLWMRKKKLLEPKEDNVNMFAGRFLEDGIAKMWQAQTGHKLVEGSELEVIYVDDERPYLRASPDRTYMTDEEELLEVKNVMKSLNEIPKHWFCQHQYAMGVIKFKRGCISWLENGFNLNYRYYNLDRGFYDYMVEKVDHFWNYNILQNIPPPATTIDDLLLRFPSHIDGKQLDINAKTMDKIEKIKRLKEIEEGITGERKELEQELKALIEDNERLMYMGRPVCTYKKSNDSEKFDTKRFKKDHPEMYTNYITMQKGSRRLLLK